MEKTNKRYFWQVDVSEKIELDTVHAALFGACNRMVEEKDIEGTDAEIDRIDIREDKTTVFLTASKKAADVFAEAVKVSFPEAKIATSSLRTSNIKKMQASL